MRSMAEMGRGRERVTNSTEIDIERNRRLFNDSKKGVVHYDIYVVVRNKKQMVGLEHLKNNCSLFLSFIFCVNALYLLR